MGVLNSIAKGAACFTDKLLKDMARNAENFSHDHRFSEERRAEFAAKAGQYENARASFRDAAGRL